MNGTWGNTGSPASMPKTYFLGIIFSWNIKLMPTNLAGSRWGRCDAGRILTIVFAVRSDAIRPITGWVADKQTAELFIKEWGQS